MPPSRLDELRRRVQSDPASIAFAQLAEEDRRSGQTEEAVRVCRDGLTRHPGYLSARVTLGRALLDLGQLIGAREELEFVVAEAPENLTAVRGLAEISNREGHTVEALTYYQRALTLARHDPEIEEIVQQLSRQAGADAASPTSGLPVEEAHLELLAAADRVPLAAPQPEPNADKGATALFDFDRLVADLGSPAAPAQVEAVVEGRTATVPLDLPQPISLRPDPFAALQAELRAADAPRPAARNAPWAPPDEEEPSEPMEQSDWPPAPAKPAETAETADTAGHVPFSAADVLADTLLTEVPLDTPADAPDDTAEAAAVRQDAFLAGDEGAGPALVQAETAGWPEPADMEDDDAISPEPETSGATAPAWPAEDAVSPIEAADAIDTALLSVDASAVAAAAAYEAAPALPHIEEAGLSDKPAATSTPNPPAAARPAEDVLDELEEWLTTLQDRSSE